MLARENYSFKKYQRELANKKKAEEKRQKKLQKKAMDTRLESGQASGESAPSENVSGENASAV